MKNKTHKLHRSNIIHKIPCDKFDQSYVGQTGHYLKTWINEHKRSVRDPIENPKTALAQHSKSQLQFWHDIIVRQKFSIYYKSWARNTLKPNEIFMVIIIISCYSTWISFIWRHIIQSEQNYFLWLNVSCDTLKRGSIELHYFRNRISLDPCCHFKKKNF